LQLSHPFDSLAPIPDQGWLTQFFRRPDARAASGVLERMLARIAPRVPTADEVAGIYRHFRVSPRRARPVSIALWSRMFHHCRRHGVGSEAEWRYLRALLEAFDLRECDVEMRRDGERSPVLRPTRTRSAPLLTSSASPTNLPA
jgi:hypothetical protein